MSVERNRQEWEELASLDPLWAVLTYPKYRYGKWQLDAFFATGRDEVAHVMKAASRHDLPQRRNVALDFGCGVGRLTRALAEEFDHVYGVDISQSMIEHAKVLNADIPNCTFVVNPFGDLALFENESFGFVYSSLVLQHLPTRRQIFQYVSEFLRVTRAGGLVVFQLLSRIPLLERMQLRRRLYSGLRAVGMPSTFLYRRLGLAPIRAQYVDSAQMVAYIEAVGGHCEEVDSVRVGTGGRCSSTYFVKKAIGA